jgi:transposase InsO family protein
MKFHQQFFTVEKMCKTLNISCSSYYNWKQNIDGKRSAQDEALLSEIKTIHKFSHETYGSPRIYNELKNKDVCVSRAKVARLMSKNNIRSVHAKKFKITTNSKHNYPVCDNILDRNFNPEREGKVWVSDITYIATKEGWLYLTIVLDLYDRKAIGWALSSRMFASETVIPALKMAKLNRPIVDDLIFHSDRGVQYACNEFKKQLENPLIKQSMSRKGNCWDNAVAESFFKSLKKECVYRNNYLTRKEAELSVFQWIEMWYNTNRIHSSLGNKSIKEFAKSNKNQNLAA